MPMRASMHTHAASRPCPHVKDEHPQRMTTNLLWQLETSGRHIISWLRELEPKKVYGSTWYSGEASRQTWVGHVLPTFRNFRNFAALICQVWHVAASPWEVNDNTFSFRNYVEPTPGPVLFEWTTPFRFDEYTIYSSTETWLDLFATSGVCTDFYDKPKETILLLVSTQ